MPSAAFSDSSGNPSTNWLMTSVRVPATAAIPATSTIAVASDGGTRRRRSQPTSGDEQCRQQQRDDERYDHQLQPGDHPQHGDAGRDEQQHPPRPGTGDAQSSRHVQVVAVRHRRRRDHDVARRRRCRRRRLWLRWRGGPGWPRGGSLRCEGCLRGHLAEVVLGRGPRLLTRRAHRLPPRLIGAAQVVPNVIELPHAATPSRSARPFGNHPSLRRPAPN